MTGHRPSFWLALALGIALPAVARAQLDPAFVGKVTLDTQYLTGANQATDVAFSADGRAVVTTKLGPVYVRRANGTVNMVPYPFGGTLDIDSEKGLLGVVADPDVATNRAFYFYVSNGPTNDKHRIYRAVLQANDTLVVDATPIVAASRGLGPGLEGPVNHDGGGMFIYNRQLYVGVGDTGSNASPPVNKYGSCLNKGNGKILRVNLDGTVPSDNPLAGLSSVTGCDTTTGPWTTAAPDRRIFAWGLRNPWRFWVDTRTGLMWIGDVGEITSEEISIGGGNRHWGYPFEEGSMVWGNVDGMNCITMTPSRSCSPPAFAYGHDVGEAITGGLIPEGCGWTNVFGGTAYVFGDSSDGWVRALPVNAARTGFTSSTLIPFASYGGGSPVSFRMGPDGSMYVVLVGTGAVHRYTPTNKTGSDCSAAAAVPASGPGWTWLLVVGLGLVGMWGVRRVRISRVPSP
jgi:glucose/arabinose dehydrogenase